MEIQEITNIVINQGFAVAVAWFALTRLEKTVKENTTALVALVSKLDNREE